MEKNEFETGQVFSFADLVNYASGAVVSRTIIKKPTGTVTVFAFDQGAVSYTHLTLPTKRIV